MEAGRATGATPPVTGPRVAGEPELISERVLRGSERQNDPLQSSGGYVWYEVAGMTARSRPSAP